MPRRARDERLETRAARLALTPRREPYWRNIQEGRAVGYRRIAGKAGTWIARYYDANGERVRRYHSLGSADDFLDADGVDTLTFGQAQECARAWFKDVQRSGGRMAEPLTVAQAMAAYLADYRARGGRDLPGLERTIAVHILPRLGGQRVADLTSAAIRAWHHALASAPARVRTRAGSAQAVRAADTTRAQRARRSTANRVLTVLRAALSLAFREGLVPDDAAWRRVQPFRGADAPRVRFLTDAEAVRLANAAAPDFRPMIVAGLLTGCRWGELVELRAGNFIPEAGVLLVSAGKTGRGRRVVLSPEGVAFFRERAAGKRSDDPLLPRQDGCPWGKSAQARPMRDACAKAGIEPAVSFHLLRHVHAARLAREGVPMSLIAAQIGNSEAICAKHYAHLSPSFVAEGIRAAFSPLGLLPDAKVIAIA